MTRASEALVRALRAWVRRLQTQRARVGALSRLTRSALMIPAMAALVLFLRMRSRLGGRFTAEARTASGARFICRPPDLVGMYLWLFDVWEPDLTAFIVERLRPGDAFIDIGANLGYYSILAAARVEPGGRVAAIDASSSVVEDLGRNIVLNPGGAPIRTINMAVLARAGVVDVFAGPRHNIGRASVVPQPGKAPAQRIDGAPLPDMLSAEEIRSARLIKVDVEGAEDQVLAGLHAMLPLCRDDLEIVVELSPRWWRPDPGGVSPRPVDVLTPMLDAGFHAYEIPNNYWPWRYLWPRCVVRPRRIRHGLDRRVSRLDLVLSRMDAEHL